MKKVIKKVGLFVLGCFLCTQAIMPVMAQPLNVTPAGTGTIRIHRFAGTTAAAPTLGTPLNGIPYTATRVRLRADVASTPENLRVPANFEAITGAGAHTATASTVAGIATLSDLPLGIYLVTEGEHTVTSAADRVAPFIVGIPRQVANEDDEYEWIYDVNVYPKTDEDIPSVFDKELDLIWDEDFGETVARWTLESTIPRLIGNATRFEFIDELDERFTFITGSVVGTFNRMDYVDEVLTLVPVTLVDGLHFQVNVNVDNVLSIALTQAGFDLLSEHAILSPDPDSNLTFTFRTRLSLVEEDLGEITNSARLYYNEDEDGIYTTTPPPTENLFALEIEKVDVNGDRLREATFQLFLNAAGTIPAFPIEGVNRSFTTTDGLVFIPGLPAGTFFLRETASPPGFRPITDVMEVTIGTTQVNPNRNYVVTRQVVNDVEDGFVLPETGGLGTVLFSVFGLLLVGGAVSLFLVAKRRRNEHD